MSDLELMLAQKLERNECLDNILNSKASRKIIVAGPGTGKTYTFCQILKTNNSNNNLVMTFIRKLVEDMQDDLGEYAEVKTFHAYCKKILHEINGKVELISYLTQVIKKDSELLGMSYNNFDAKFQTLDEDSPAIKFYLDRGDYYEVVSFNYSVYRLYKILQQENSIIPHFDQILIDEFQDFHSLEVAFITEMEKKGSVLIVGDDDQAVYSGRNSSPNHLREKYLSGEYEIFELPFCSRCPKVIIEVINAFIFKVQKNGYLNKRINRKYEAYLEGQEYENKKYSKIITAQLSNIRIIIKYLFTEIQKIPSEDIEESHEKKYPTILIVGQRQYLNEIEKQLKIFYPQLVYSPTIESGYTVIDAYKILLKNKNSNLGWRILIEKYFDIDKQKEILLRSQNGTPMIELLDEDFISNHKRAIDIINSIINDESLSPNITKELKTILDDNFKSVVEYFKPTEAKEKPSVDTNQPSILLTSFEGCKGLSAGHVFIVGANNGSMPKINANNQIDDVECCKFIVALTRTRKCCHILSNRWLYSPKDRNGEWIPHYEKSIFISLIPQKFIEDKGYLKSYDFKS